MVKAIVANNLKLSRIALLGIRSGSDLIIKIMFEIMLIFEVCVFCCLN